MEGRHYLNINDEEASSLNWNISFHQTLVKIKREKIKTYSFQ
jgi:hypothetical protein